MAANASGGVATLQMKLAKQAQLPPPATRKALRVSRGVSLRAVAEAIGCCPQSCLNWENGKTPQAHFLDRYVEVLRLLRDAE